jgi:hypothetical protein
MSTLAKGLTIGALASAGLAVPVVAMVTYFQTKPANTALATPDRLPQTFAALTAEALPVEAPVEETASPAPDPTYRKVPAAAQDAPPRSQAPPGDPRDALTLPSVERPALLQSHDTRVPSVRSIGVPAAIPKASSETLQYEEELR